LKAFRIIILSTILLTGCGPSQQEKQLSLQNTELKQEVSALVKNLESKKNNADQTTQQVIQLKQDLTEARANKGSLNTELKILQAKLKNSLQQREVTQTRLSSLKRKLEQDKTQHQQNKHGLETRIRDISRELKQSQITTKQQSLQDKIELDKKSMAVEENLRTIVEKNRKIDLLSETLKLVRNSEKLQSRKQREKINALKTELNDTQQALNKFQRENSRLGDELRLQQEQIDKLQSRLTSTQAQEQDLSETLKQTESNLNQARLKASQLNTTYDQMLRERNQLLSRDFDKDNKITDMRIELETAQREVARLSGARGIYTIQQQDNLSSIARFFYHNGNLWQKIFEANSFILKDPDLIYRGMVLIIPQ